MAEQIISIVEITPSGLSLGRLKGLPVFIPGGVPGDQLAIRINEHKKNHAFGRIIKIIKPGPSRIKPRCGSFPACGGCQWQMLAYPAQLTTKTIMVKDALAKIGRLDPKLVRDTLGAAEPWFYRNKVQYPLGLDQRRLIMGYYQPGSHQIVDLAECYIQEKVLTELARVCRQVLSAHRLPIYDEASGYGLLRHLILRSAAGTGEILLGLVTTRPKIPNEPVVIEALRQAVEKLLKQGDWSGQRLVGLVQNINSEKTNLIFGDRNRLLWGQDHVREKLAHLTVQLSLTAFHQVNHQMAVKLYQTIEKLARLTGRETVVDLYSGVGFISLWLARHCREVFGIEDNEAAVRDAVRNQKLNGLTNCHWLAGPAEQKINWLLERRIRPDLVILDPPRVGLSPKALAKILALKSGRIIYVSCNPTTLARDLAQFCQKGYRLETVQPLDMFPQTSHVEAIAVLARID